MKILWFDTETTGLDPYRNGMIQLAMIMDIDGKAVNEVQINIQPFPFDVFQNKEGKQSDANWGDILGTSIPDSIETPTGIKIADLCGYLKPQIALGQINAFLQKHISRFDKKDKVYIGGYNVPFDIAFLSKFYEKSRDNYLGSYINWKQIDVRSILYLLDYKGTVKLDNYKLSTICEYYGIELEAHNPMSDIKATREIFYKLIGGEI